MKKDRDWFLVYRRILRIPFKGFGVKPCILHAMIKANVGLWLELSDDRTTVDATGGQAQFGDG